jgi:hypothetical protein
MYQFIILFYLVEMSIRSKIIMCLKEEVIIECPSCHVCSIKLSAEEHAAVTAGQQMIEVCQVCGKEVTVNV